MDDEGIWTEYQKPVRSSVYTQPNNIIKGIVHPKLKTESLIIHPHVLPNPFIFRPSFIFRTQIKIFLVHTESSDPPIDSRDPYKIKVQNRSKEIGKIIHVTSVVQP